MANPASWLFATSVGRRINVLAAFVAIATFIILIALQTADRLRDLYAQQDRSELSISTLLAGQIGGAVRWAKGDVIEATFAPVVAQAGNGLAALTALDAAGKPLVQYRSKDLAAYDLDEFARGNGDALAAGQTVSVEAGRHFVVALPVFSGAERSRVGTLLVAWSRERLHAD
ncbi:MAG TPA: hypothetical protein VMQ73_11650, partial [Methylomirabilota bacterium]|nr:hypothetical protein [Methylomirabilota bacterium]